MAVREQELVLQRARARCVVRDETDAALVHERVVEADDRGQVPGRLARLEREDRAICVDGALDEADRGVQEEIAARERGALAERGLVDADGPQRQDDEAEGRRRVPRTDRVTREAQVPAENQVAAHDEDVVARGQTDRAVRRVRREDEVARREDGRPVHEGREDAQCGIDRVRGERAVIRQRGRDVVQPVRVQARVIERESAGQRSFRTMALRQSNFEDSFAYPNRGALALSPPSGAVAPISRCGHPS